MEPLTGWRFVQVRQQRTKKDYAAFMNALAQQRPEAEEPVIVQDNLNTHTSGSFYAAFVTTTADPVLPLSFDDGITRVDESNRNDVFFRTVEVN